MVADEAEILEKSFRAFAFLPTAGVINSAALELLAVEGRRRRFGALGGFQQFDRPTEPGRGGLTAGSSSAPAHPRSCIMRPEDSICLTIS